MSVVGISAIYGYFLTQGVHDRQVAKLVALSERKNDQVKLIDDQHIGNKNFDEESPLEEHETIDIEASEELPKSNQRSLILWK